MIISAKVNEIHIPFIPINFFNKMINGKVKIICLDKLTIRLYNPLPNA